MRLHTAHTAHTTHTQPLIMEKDAKAVYESITMQNVVPSLPDDLMLHNPVVSPETIKETENLRVPDELRCENIHLSDKQIADTRDLFQLAVNKLHRINDQKTGERRFRLPIKRRHDLYSNDYSSRYFCPLAVTIVQKRLQEAGYHCRCEKIGNVRSKGKRCKYINEDDYITSVALAFMTPIVTLPITFAIMFGCIFRNDMETHYYSHKDILSLDVYFDDRDVRRTYQGPW